MEKKCFNVEDFEDQKIAQLLKCNISGGVLNNPVMINCGHSFCKSCQDEYFKTNTQCPICHTEINKDEFKESTPSIEILSSLKMTCPFKESGCSYSDLYPSMITHIDNCEFKPLNCEQCNFIGTAKELSSHSPKCPKRKISCMFCFNKICFDEIKEHSENCVYVEVKCPQNCNQKIKKKNLDLHIQLYCDNSITKCCYESIGCLFSGNKEEIIEHCNDPFVIIFHEKLKTVRENKNHEELMNRFKELSLKIDKFAQSNKQINKFDKLEIEQIPLKKIENDLNKNNQSLKKKYSFNDLLNETGKKMEQSLKMITNEFCLKKTNSSFFSCFDKGDSIIISNDGMSVMGGGKYEIIVARKPAQSMKTYSFRIDSCNSWISIGMVNIEKVKILNYNLRHGYHHHGCFFLYNNGFHLRDTQPITFCPSPTFGYTVGDIIDITWNSQQSTIEFVNQAKNLSTKIYMGSLAVNLYPAVHCLSNKCRITYLG